MPIAPPAASGLSPWSSQVLGGFQGINWTDLFARLMGIGGQQQGLGDLIPPQLGAINPLPRLPLPQRVARPPVAPIPQAPMARQVPIIDPLAQAYGVGGNVGYGAGGMDVSGQGAFGDLGAFGVGYGDTY